FEEIPLPLDWPVWVTHSEARSFAAWRGKSLPTEAQFDRAGYGSPDGEYRPYPWGDDEPDKDRGNFDFHAWDPVPVTATPRGDSAFGVSQILGNGWEWTADLFRPLPGFQQFDFYPGYSANFFDDDHFVIKGGSPRTARKLLRRSFRNWFRQGYKYAYSGFRLVE
ncbi:MAG: SUMF1/EgtB/PvdO family nonheme iron enzyme, partial [bacterium]|nr:SUMF1/EgtB/PvdO family nonheme iron enzyme [bacterium]